MQDALNQLLKAGTAVIADVFDSFDQMPQVLDNALRSFKSDGASFAGPAYTITGQTVTWKGGDRAKLEAIDAMPSNVVALWASMDAKGVCCFGDLLATAMQGRGCVGAIVDGGVRDVAFLRQCGMPVVARYCTPAQGVGRWGGTLACDRCAGSRPGARSIGGMALGQPRRHPRCRRRWSHRRAPEDARTGDRPGDRMGKYRDRLAGRDQERLAAAESPGKIWPSVNLPSRPGPIG